MMTIRPLTLTIRVTLLLAAAISLTTLSGCCSGSCQDTTKTSARTTDGKDAKDSRVQLTSGPHQGN